MRAIASFISFTASDLGGGLLAARRLRRRVSCLCFVGVRLLVAALLLLGLSFDFVSHRDCFLALVLLLSRWFLLLLLSLVVVVSIAIAVSTALAASDAPRVLGAVMSRSTVLSTLLVASPPRG